jgi:pimeloyl-ACP methyl ester carboxylesterase
MNEWDNLRVRVHGGATQPTLIYLPGLHGDWTLVSSFRVALCNRARFVEFTYPRTLKWSIEDHSAAVLKSLADHEISEGWLLAESFGSVPAWSVIQHSVAAGFNVRGIILSGGFVRYPYMPLVKMARAINRAIPLWCVRLACWVYGRYAVLRHRRAPETLECVSEFARRRSEEADRQAICYRYELIQRSDPRELSQNASVPVYQLCGFVDPIVPWFPVRAWLKRHCANCKGWRLIWRADHNVLGTAPQTAADQVIEWMNAGGSSSRDQRSIAQCARG